MIGARLGSRLWWGLLPLLVALWGAGALASSSMPGIPATPLVTLVAAPGIAYAQDVALAVSLGALVTMLWSSAPRLRRWAVGWMVASIGLVAASAAALQSDVTTLQIGVDATSLLEILSDTAIGRAILVQFACLATALGLVALGGAVKRRWPVWCAVALVAGCVAAPAVAGHAGLSGDHGVAAICVGLHAAAISLWVGGLAVVSAQCLLDPSSAPSLLPRFSGLALACVIVAAESGLLSASLTLGSLSDLVGSTYGSVIVAKAVILAWLIRLGWLQRRHALDRLPEASVPMTVARIAATELTLMGAAIALSVVLVRIGPPPIPMAGLAPLTIVALGIAAPMLVAGIRPARWRMPNAWPEASMVVLLLVLVETGGVGLIRTVLGSIGLLLELMMLVLVGWLSWSSSLQSIAAIVIGLVGLPLALVANAVIAHEVDWRMTLVAVLAGEWLLGAWWIRVRKHQVEGQLVEAVIAT